MKRSVIIAAMMLLVCGLSGVAEGTAQTAQEEVEAFADEKARQEQTGTSEGEEEEGDEEESSTAAGKTGEDAEK